MVKTTKGEWEKSCKEQILRLARVESKQVVKRKPDNKQAVEDVKVKFDYN